ncbi:endonuclease V [Pedobacter soli]|uniref:Endonuclease V n=1 Tax=Pedobacter soli TaxID=390242 RepID=A0A1G6ZDK9_9SPHI|nr:endonuclease V [Pedobacter soli]SDE00729.1 Endonuclease V [Pedobacter soli]
MKLIIDVAYSASRAKVVGGFFESWDDGSLLGISSKFVDHVGEYISGEFYKRELPCILAFLEDIDLKAIALIIIDGFIYLDDDGKKGLGAYLYESLGRAIPVIGVAKSKFYNNNAFVREIFRGQSKNGIYVSAIGIDLEDASGLVQGMSGDFRLPDLIKRVDTETKIWPDHS